MVNRAKLDQALSVDRRPWPCDRPPCGSWQGDAALTGRLLRAFGDRSTQELMRIMDVSDETVRRMRGGAVPALPAVMRLCAHLGLSADWLLMGRGTARVADIPSAVLESASVSQLCEALSSALQRPRPASADAELKSLPFSGLAVAS